MANGTVQFRAVLDSASAETHAATIPVKFGDGDAPDQLFSWHTLALLGRSLPLLADYALTMRLGARMLSAALELAPPHVPSDYKPKDRSARRKLAADVVALVPTLLEHEPTYLSVGLYLSSYAEADHTGAWACSADAARSAVDAMMRAQAHVNRPSRAERRGAARGATRDRFERMAAHDAANESEEEDEESDTACGSSDDELASTAPDGVPIPSRCGGLPFDVGTSGGSRARLVYELALAWFIHWAKSAADRTLRAACGLVGAAVAGHTVRPAVAALEAARRDCTAVRDCDDLRAMYEARADVARTSRFTHDSVAAELAMAQLPSMWARGGQLSERNAIEAPCTATPALLFATMMRCTRVCAARPNEFEAWCDEATAFPPDDNNDDDDDDNEDDDCGTSDGDSDADVDVDGTGASGSTDARLLLWHHVTSSTRLLRTAFAHGACPETKRKLVVTAATLADALRRRRADMFSADGTDPDQGRLKLPQAMDMGSVLAHLHIIYGVTGTVFDDDRDGYDTARYEFSLRECDASNDAWARVVRDGAVTLIAMDVLAAAARLKTDDTALKAASAASTASARAVAGEATARVDAAEAPARVPEIEEYSPENPGIVVTSGNGVAGVRTVHCVRSNGGSNGRRVGNNSSSSSGSSSGGSSNGNGSSQRSTLRSSAGDTRDQDCGSSNRSVLDDSSRSRRDNSESRIESRAQQQQLESTQQQRERMRHLQQQQQQQQWQRQQWARQRQQQQQVWERRQQQLQQQLQQQRYQRSYSPERRNGDSGGSGRRAASPSRRKRSRSRSPEQRRVRQDSSADAPALAHASAGAGRQTVGPLAKLLEMLTRADRHGSVPVEDLPALRDQYLTAFRTNEFAMVVALSDWMRSGQWSTPQWDQLWPSFLHASVANVLAQTPSVRCQANGFADQLCATYGDMHSSMEPADIAALIDQRRRHNRQLQSQQAQEAQLEILRQRRLEPVQQVQPEPEC